MPIGRVFEYTDEALVERFKPGGNPDLAALAALSTLFVEETSEDAMKLPCWHDNARKKANSGSSFNLFID